MASNRTPGAWTLELLLSAIPEPETYGAKKFIDGRTLYYANTSGVVRFFLHNPRDERGYGGSVFSGVLEDGTAFSVRGPWSSSCSTVNALGVLPRCVPASATSDCADWGRGYTLYGLSGVTRSVIEQALVFLPDWNFDWQMFDGEGAAPSFADTSDEQNRVIHAGTSRGERRELFTYRHELPRCPTCEGRGVLRHSESGKGRWKDHHGDGFSSPCPTCQSFLLSGCAPINGVRWGRVINRGEA